MSAALDFTLVSPDVLSRCGFPQCIGKAFHEGEHEFAPRIPAPRPQPVYRCSECGVHFIIYGERLPGETRICGEQACLLSFCHREATNIPLACSCSQRRYPHELAVHTKLRSESYNPEFKNRWPWSLMLSSRVEPSTEREAA